VHSLNGLSSARGPRVHPPTAPNPHANVLQLAADFKIRDAAGFYRRALLQLFAWVEVRSPLSRAEGCNTDLHR